MPLFFQLAFLAAFWWLLDQSEYETAQAARSKAIVTEADLLLKHFYDSGTALFAYALSHSRVIESSYDNSVRKIPEGLQLLTTWTQDDASQSESIKRLRPIVEQGLKILKEAKESIDESGSAVAYFKTHRLTRQLENVMTKLVTELNRMTERERTKSKFGSLSDVRARMLVKQAVLVSACFNIVLAISLSLTITRGITQRIETLVNNTVRLTKRDPLLPVQAGNDEIARLDQTFHDMASALAEVERVKKDFLAMVSHDLRTPLTFVQGTLTMLSIGAIDPGSEAGKRRLEDAEKETDRLMALIADLLDMAKMDAGKFDIQLQAIPLWAIIQRSVSSVSAMAQRAAVRIEAPQTDTEVRADPERLMQVLVNLLSNAIKASEHGKTVSITIDSPEESGFVEVSVRDQGPGIAGEHQERIFERFQQIEDERGSSRAGAGLGLSICKAIIEGHGGQIGVESSPGSGSRFYFRIPRA